MQFVLHYMSTMYTEIITLYREINYFVWCSADSGATADTSVSLARWIIGMYAKSEH